MGLDEFIDRHIKKTGNAGIAIRTDDSMILFDPFFTEKNEISFQNYLLENSDVENKVAYFTHAHYDHGLTPRGIRFLLENDFTLKFSPDTQDIHIHRWWSPRSRELNELFAIYSDQIDTKEHFEDMIGKTYIESFPSEHAHVGLAKYLKPLSKLPRRIMGFVEHKMHPSKRTIGFEIVYEDTRMMHMGSQGGSAYVPTDVDVLFLPLSEGPAEDFEPDYSKEKAIINRIKPKITIPIHDDGIDGVLMEYDAEDFQAAVPDVKLLNPVYRVPGLMNKEICCKNWVHLFDYIENTPDFPSGKSGREAVEGLLKGLVDNPTFLIQNPDNPDEISVVKEEHLRDENYWHSNVFNLIFFSNAAGMIGGHEPLFQAGIVTGYKTVLNEQPNKHLQISRAWDPKTLFKRVSKTNKKFNRTKNPVATKVSNNNAKVKLNYLRKFKGEVSKNVCDWNRGMYTGLGKFTGASDIKVIEEECLTNGYGDCQFNLDWSPINKFQQATWFGTSMLVPSLVYNYDMDNMLRTDLIMRQQGIIDNLLSEAEYLNQQLRIQDVLQTGEDIGAQVLHENKNLMTPMVNLVTRVRRFMDFSEKLGGLQQMYDNTNPKDAKRLNMLKDNIITTLVNAETAYKQIANSYENFRQVYNPREEGLKDLNKDLEACVCLMIDRNYQSYIDIEYDFESVKVPDSYDSSKFNRGVFINLFKNAREAIVERKAGDDKYRGKVLIKSKQENDKTVVSIYDNGIGVPDGFAEQMFKKKETTKASGTGIGLYTAKFILDEYGGNIKYEKSELDGYVTKMVVELNL